MLVGSLISLDLSSSTRQDDPGGGLRHMKMHLKRFVARSLCHPRAGQFIARATADQINIKGHTIFTDSPYITPSTKASLFWGFYEAAERRLIKDYLYTNRTIIEIGSSIGVTSTFLRRYLSSEHHLYCVEPNPYLLDSLNHNIKYNNPNSPFTIMNLALSYDVPSGHKVPFSIALNNTGSKVSRDADIHGISVESTTLHSLIETLNLSDYTLICDIEGMEHDLFKYERDALFGCRQLIIELHSTTYRGEHRTIPDIKLCIIDNHGFDLVARDGNAFVFKKL